LIQVRFDPKSPPKVDDSLVDGAFPAPGMEQDMGYKTVMVSLALDRPNDACLAVAGDIAERFEARVVGIAASDIRPTLYFAEGGYAQKVLDEEGAAVRKRLSELETEFRAAVSKRAKSVEWRSAQTLTTIPYVMQHARAADVIVVGARAEPPTVQWLDLRSVLVAWKDVREARRAVLDALPILAAAKDVTIAEIPEQHTKSSEALSHVEDVAGWLRGHGIVANTVVTKAETGAAIAEQIDRIAANVGAGAVIAGAYGHSRFREWILGGVTRHLAAESSRCAFLSR
jgi:nucleotide-binding universal stress UspA family protein